MRIVVNWIIGAVALYATVYLGHTLHISGLGLRPGANGLVSALGAVLILTLVNAIVRPVVLFFFAGLNCLTLGLFSFVVNALMFLLTGYLAQQLNLGFRVDGFLPALFGSIVLSVLTGLADTLVPSDKKK